MKLRKTLIALLVMSVFAGFVFMDQKASAKEQSLENPSMEADKGVTEENVITADDDNEVSDDKEIADDNNTLSSKESKKVQSEEKKESVKSTAKASKKSNKKKAGKEKAPYTKGELRLMSSIIYCEAGNQPYAGKLAVGIVVMNRKASSDFPNTVKGVIYDPYQFSPARNGALSAAMAKYDRGGFKSASDKQCIKAAKAALSGEKKVTYNNRTYNLRTYHFFSRYVSGARLTIGAHMFK